jgi:hypothetical protein
MARRSVHASHLCREFAKQERRMISNRKGRAEGRELTASELIELRCDQIDFEAASSLRVRHSGDSTLPCQDSNSSHHSLVIRFLSLICKFAGNSDPLRGIIAFNSDPF